MSVFMIVCMIFSYIIYAQARWIISNVNYICDRNKSEKSFEFIVEKEKSQQDIV